MRIIIANYRYFIAGGPEKYMFKFMDAAEKMGIEVIPFSVKNPQNEKTPYAKYFAKPRSNQIMYADTKKSISNLIGMVRATVWNYDAEKRLRHMIRDTKPDAVYILHEVNHLSPSIIRAARKERVRVVHRISDFFMFCPKYDFLCENEICEACLHGDYRKAIEHRCVKGSKAGTLLRVMAMKLYAATKVFDDVDQYICTCEFSKNKLIEGGISKDKITCVPTFIDATSITPCYENDKYFLFLGRMAHQKGTIYAIEAMKYLRDTDFIKIWAGPEYGASYAVVLLLIIPVTVPLIQNLGIEIQRAKNMHKARAVVYLAIAIANVFISIPLIKIMGPAGAALGTAISLIAGNVIFMNWYYHARIGMNMFYFWKEIAKFVPALIGPCVVGIIIMNFANIMGLVKLGVFAIVYTVVYGLSMYFLGMNEEEKQLVMGPIRKILRK